MPWCLQTLTLLDGIVVIAIYGRVYRLATHILKALVEAGLNSADLLVVNFFQDILVLKIPLLSYSCLTLLAHMRACHAHHWSALPLAWQLVSQAWLTNIKTIHTSMHM